MKKLTKVFTSVALCCFLLTISNVTFSQEQSTTTRETETGDDDDMDYGWIGLIGLAGLLGLRKRDRDDRDVRPGNRV